MVVVGVDVVPSALQFRPFLRMRHDRVHELLQRAQQQQLPLIESPAQELANDTIIDYLRDSSMRDIGDQCTNDALSLTSCSGWGAGIGGCYLHGNAPWDPDGIPSFAQNAGFLRTSG
jgi:hypothetical protein